MATASSNAEYWGKKFRSTGDAVEFLLKFGGSLMQHPKNLPIEWEIETIRPHGIRYTNPNNREEWVEMVPNPSHPNQSGRAKLTYHKPSQDSFIHRHGPRRDPVKEIKNCKVFNQKDPVHIAVLETAISEHNSIKESLDPTVSKTKLSEIAYDHLKTLLVRRR